MFLLVLPNFIMRLYCNSFWPGSKCGLKNTKELELQKEKINEDVCGGIGNRPVMPYFCLFVLRADSVLIISNQGDW